MCGVIGKRSNLIRDAKGIPRRVGPGRYGINRVMYIHSEIKQATGCQNANQLSYDPARRLGVIDNVIAEDNLESLIRKRKRLSKSGHCGHATLPGGKEAGIANCPGV